MGGYYLEIEPDRTQLARYGLMVGDVQQVVASGLSAETVTTTVEGRERYGVSVRFPRDLRSHPQAFEREVLVPPPKWGCNPAGACGDGEAGAGAGFDPHRECAAYIFLITHDSQPV